MRTACGKRVFTLVLVVAATGRAASTGSQSVFATPDEAATALVAALMSDDYARFLSVAGYQMAGFWVPQDVEREVSERDRFLSEARRIGLKVDEGRVDRWLIYAGHIDQPFPAPLLKTDSGWRFDGDAGSRELAARRIRRNETAVVELCERFREAEFAYLAQAGAQQFAYRIRSTPGQRDGLFWSDSEEDESPLGPPFAAAAFAERRPADGSRPFFGYYFKILTAQGPDATGGALNYLTNGRLRKGFALIAWPAEYGFDGVHSFLINHFGDIYQKDMGAGTRLIAESLTIFNPDRSWSRLYGQE